MHLAAAADQMHAPLRHLSGEAAHVLGIDPGEIAVADAVEVAAIGHGRQLDSPLLQGWEILYLFEEGRHFARGTAIDADDLGAEIACGLDKELGILVPPIAAVVQGHVDDGRGGIAYFLQYLEDGRDVQERGEGFQHQGVGV